MTTKKKLHESIKSLKFYRALKFPYSGSRLRIKELGPNVPATSAMGSQFMRLSDDCASKVVVCDIARQESYQSSAAENTEMSADNTDSESLLDSEHSDGCSEYHIENKNENGNGEATLGSLSNESLDSCDLAYAFEPMADEEWLKLYEKELEEDKKLQQMLKRRLNGKSPVDSW